MILSTIKSLFGQGSTPEEQKFTSPPGPFGLRIGRAVSMDMMRLRLEEKKLALPLPSETLVISGHGVIDLGSGSLMHRFYDDHHTMLQVLCDGGVADSCIREIMLFRPWDAVSPTSDAEWRIWDGPNGKIGAATFSADGHSFDRVWGDASTHWVQPTEFVEDIRLDDGSFRQIHQKVMPYRREAGVLVENLILAVERDLPSNDRGTVTFMIGYGLSPADVTPI
jgi:Protein of unknown function (DUF2491)